MPRIEKYTYVTVKIEALPPTDATIDISPKEISLKAGEEKEFEFTCSFKLNRPAIEGGYVREYFWFYNPVTKKHEQKYYKRYRVDAGWIGFEGKKYKIKIKAPEVTKPTKTYLTYQVIFEGT